MTFNCKVYLIVAGKRLIEKLLIILKILYVCCQDVKIDDHLMLKKGSFQRNLWAPCNYWSFKSGFWSLNSLRHAATVDTKSITKKIIFCSKLAPIWYFWNFQILDPHFLPIRRPVWIFGSNGPVDYGLSKFPIFFDNIFLQIFTRIKKHVHISIFRI